MFYVVARQHPAQAPHPAPRARRLALRRGAVRRRGLHRPRLAAVPPVPPTRTHRIEPVGPSSSRRPTTAYHRHRLIKTGGIEPGRRGHRARPAVLQQRRRDGRRPAGGARCPTTRFYRNGEADEMLFVHEGGGTSTRTSGRSATAPATTSSCRSGRRGGSSRTRAVTSGCSTWSRRRRSSRRSATATNTASCSSTRPTRSATSGSPTRSRPGRRGRVP